MQFLAPTVSLSIGWRLLVAFVCLLYEDDLMPVSGNSCFKLSRTFAVSFLKSLVYVEAFEESYLIC